MPRNFEATYNPTTKTLDLRLFGVVGEDIAGDGTFIDATAVAQALANKPEKINAQINSRGGSVFHGLAIYELLKTSGAKISGQIVGLCGSIMSVIAAACDKLEMNSAALMMIHEASGAVAGRSSDMRMTAEITDKMNDSQVEIFTARTGKPEEEIRAMLSAETWMTAKEALAGKFITKISSAKTVAAEFNENQFHNVPAHVVPMLAKLQAQAQGDEQMADQTPTTPPTTPATPAPAAPPVDVEAIKAQARADEMNRQTTITALCATAKRPELAAAFCKDLTISVADVQGKLFEALCKQNGPLGDEGGTAGETPAKPSENDKYVAEFKAEASYAKTMTEAEYVAMRRVDDGLDVLTIGAAK